MKYFLRTMMVVFSALVLVAFQGCYTQVGKAANPVDEAYVDAEDYNYQAEEDTGYYVYDGADYYLDGSEVDSLYEYGVYDPDMAEAELAEEYYFYDEDLGYVFTDPIYYDSYPYSYTSYRVSGGYPYGHYSSYGWHPPSYSYAYSNYPYYDPFYPYCDPWAYTSIGIGIGFYPPYYPPYGAFYPPYYGPPVYYPPYYGAGYTGRGHGYGDAGSPFEYGGRDWDRRDATSDRPSEHFLDTAVMGRCLMTIQIAKSNDTCMCISKDDKFRHAHTYFQAS